MNPELRDKNTEELLRQLLAYQKKEVRQTRLTVLVSFLLVLGILAALVMVVPRVLKLADGAESTLAEVNRIAASAEELIGSANTMVTENTDAVTETIRKLNEVDFDSLNAAIRNLDDAVRPLAELARKLGG